MILKDARPCLGHAEQHAEQFWHSVQGEARSGCLINYDDSAYRRPRSSPATSDGHQQAPLITLDSEGEESGGSSADDGQTTI